MAAPASVEVGRKNEYYATEKEFVYAMADAMHEEYWLIVEASLVVQIDDAWIPALWDQMLPNADLSEYLKYCDLRAVGLIRPPDTMTASCPIDDRKELIS